ncbi:tetratricopeptide repeat-containing sulfotransferase family protein [Roseospira navarrensis]|nr:tetratricopeptide repeat-containing sulfotransferase family protein [Roseospira navarrensis]
MSRKSKAPPPRRSGGPGPARPAGGTLGHLVPKAGPTAPTAGRSGPTPKPTGDPRRLAAEGHRLLARGDARGAERLFREALALDGHEPAALSGLGLVAAQSGHLEPAATLFLKAAEAQPGAPDHGVNAGSALWRLGQRERALGVLRETARRHNRDHRARLALGAALMDSGHLDDAEAEARAALALKGPDSEARALLGRVRLRAGRPADAVPALEAAAQGAPKDPGLLSDLGLALSAAGRAEDAIATLRRAAEAAGPGRGAIEIGLNLAAALLSTQRATGAETVVRDLLARAPDHVGAHLTLGDVLQRQGRFEAARAAFSAALEQDPGNVIALRGLVKSGRVETGDPVLDSLRTAATRDLAPAARTEALFALAKALDDARADPGEVFAALHQANALQSRGRPDDIGPRTAQVERALDLFTPDLFETLAPLGHDSERPVFIVGLPRSGTSLVEQMIASHPAAVGAGELGVMPDEERRLGDRLATAEGLAGLAQEEVRTAAGRVLSVLDTAAGQAGKPDALRVTDKLPDNAMRLGLIALLFPKARVIVCRRDPLDTGLSLYQQNFADSVPFANALETIGRATILHDRIMAHWKAVLPLWMLTVDYETLVTDLEGEGRRLIDFLGLPWDDAVLRFHETDRAVYTASKWQVRQPVFTGSVGRWRRYADQLAPLRTILDEAGLLDRGV